MVERKAFPLRIAKDVFDAIQRWADDDLRSVNAQMEFVLRDALVKRGRLKGARTEDSENGNGA